MQTDCAHKTPLKLLLLYEYLLFWKFHNQELTKSSVFYRKALAKKCVAAYFIYQKKSVISFYTPKALNVDVFLYARENFRR